MGSATVRVRGSPHKTTAAERPGARRMFVTRRGSGVRVDHGGEGDEGHDGVRSVASTLAGVQVDRSGPRSLGMALFRQTRHPSSLLTADQ